MSDSPDRRVLRPEDHAVTPSTSANSSNVNRPARNPSYLTLSADGAYLYAVAELKEGAVSAYQRDPATGTRLITPSRSSYENGRIL